MFFVLLYASSSNYVNLLSTLYTILVEKTSGLRAVGNVVETC